MLKNSKNKIRLQSLLESDRLKVNDVYFEVFKKDLTVILKDYVDLSKEPTLKITKCADGFNIELTAVATRLKKVYSVQQKINDF